MKPYLVLAFVFIAFTFNEPDAFAQRKGGGKAAVSRVGGRGGASRPAVHAPSMSRPNVSRPSRPANLPNVSRPNTSRPTLPTTRPNIPTNRPNLGGNRPNLPTSRPNRPSNTLPGAKPPTTRPNNRPTTLPGGVDRPNLPSTRPGAGNARPNLPNTSRPGGRPSAGNVKDFLDLPGGDSGFSRPSRPSTLPGQAPGNRPTRPSTLPERLPGQSPGNRPTINRPETRPKLPDNNRPAVNLPATNRPTFDNDSIRNRFGGGHNVNIGDINVDLRQNNINNITNRWNNVNNRPFNNNWWDSGFSRRPAGYWRWQSGWNRYPAYWCWRPCTWAGFGTWFAWTWAQPITYSYGTNVVYRDNYVYVDNQQVASASDYYTQAATIAESIPSDTQPDAMEWMPLGVFELTDAEGNDASMMLQLAVSKEGVLAGTFYNASTDTSRAVEGMVDRESQRAAWHFADDADSTMVMEAGIYDLTKDQATALLHFDQDNSQSWLMVRLPAPEEAKAGG